MSLITRVRHLRSASIVSVSTKRRHFTRPADAIESKKGFDLRIESFDTASKLNVIKKIRELMGLGLMEAKELAEKAPCGLKKGVEKEEAEQIIEKMKAIGAKVIMV